MDKAILEWANTLPINFHNLDVLEVGSRNVNGTVRSVIEPQFPRSYVGIDIRPGPGVDMILDCINIVDTFGYGAFNVVVSCEALEHMEEWQSRFIAMTEATSDHFILTTRSDPFPFHEIPNDWWRFSCATMKEVAERLHLDIIDLQPDPEWPGVLLYARKRYPTPLANLLHPPSPVDRRM